MWNHGCGLSKKLDICKNEFSMDVSFKKKSAYNRKLWHPLPATCVITRSPGIIPWCVPSPSALGLARVRNSADSDLFSRSLFSQHVCIFPYLCLRLVEGWRSGGTDDRKTCFSRPCCKNKCKSRKYFLSWASQFSCLIVTINCQWAQNIPKLFIYSDNFYVIIFICLCTFRLRFTGLLIRTLVHLSRPITGHVD